MAYHLLLFDPLFRTAAVPGNPPKLNTDGTKDVVKDIASKGIQEGKKQVMDAVHSSNSSLPNSAVANTTKSVGKEVGKKVKDSGVVQLPPQAKPAVPAQPPAKPIEVAKPAVPAKPAIKAAAKPPANKKSGGKRMRDLAGGKFRSD